MFSIYLEESRKFIDNYFNKNFDNFNNYKFECYIRKCTDLVFPGPHAYYKEYIKVNKKISYVKNNDSEMYAKKINFNNETSLIELIDNVTIIRNGEKVTGDYGTLDTKNDSYKIKSKNQSKVKAIIQNNEQ